ncbi:MAG: sigma-70 family RNA polymerase sigma factor [Planctomycetota bacterium]
METEKQISSQSHPKKLSFNNERDVQLMLRVNDGDSTAMEDLYHIYRKPILNFFYHLVWNQEKAEDYMQEVFLRVWRVENYQPTGKFSTWIFQIAKNFWLNEREKIQRRPSHFSLDEEKSSEEGGESFSTDVEGKEVPPQEQLLKDELHTQIQKAIDGLSEKHKLVYLLSEYQGFKYQEIADIVGIPVGTVKSRMSNAEKELRRRLARYLDLEEVPAPTDESEES